MLFNVVYPFSDIHDTPSISSLLQPHSSSHHRQVQSIDNLLAQTSQKSLPPKGCSLQTPCAGALLAAGGTRPPRSAPPHFQSRAVSLLVRNKPAAEVGNLKKGKKKASGEMLRRCVVVCAGCVFYVFCLLCRVRFGGRMGLKWERDAAARRGSGSGGMRDQR